MKPLYCLVESIQNVVFYQVRVRFENSHVHKFVFFGRFELQTVRVEELFLHFLEFRINEHFLQLAHDLVELVVAFVVVALISYFEVLVISKQILVS